MQANLLVEGNLLQVWQSPVSQVGLAGTNGGGATKSQVVEETVAECTPGVKLTLKALNVGQEVNDVQVGVVLPGGNSGLDLVVLSAEQSDVVWAIAVAGTQVTCVAQQSSREDSTPCSTSVCCKATGAIATSLLLQAQ